MLIFINVGVVVMVLDLMFNQLLSGDKFDKKLAIFIFKCLYLLNYMDFSR